MHDFEAFDEILQHSHFWNWSPDWQLAKEIYQKFPDSYSVLTPFAYAYLEELIRSITSEYGREILNENGSPKMHKVGVRLINLAIEENMDKSPELINLLRELKVYFSNSEVTDEGDNRNSVVHGYMHSGFWNRESFSSLIYDIAKLSKFAGF